MMRLFAPCLLVLLACSKSTLTGPPEPVSGPALQLVGTWELIYSSYDEDTLGALLTFDSDGNWLIQRRYDVVGEVTGRQFYDRGRWSVKGQRLSWEGRTSEWRTRGATYQLLRSQDTGRRFLELTYDNGDIDTFLWLAS